MFWVFAKILCLRQPQVANEAVTHTYPLYKQAGIKADMAFSVSELPANSNVGNTSLFDSKETSQKDEWLGEKYLNYVLAHLLLRHTPSSMEIISLNVFYTLSYTNYELTLLTGFRDLSSKNKCFFDMTSVTNNYATVGFDCTSRLSWATSRVLSTSEKSL
jgi:hypothetical protein